MSCALCERVNLTKSGNYPYLIHEFKHSYLMLGEHQYYEGYCVLVSKKHYREMTDLPQEIAHEFFNEMLLTSKFIEETFEPKKMNMCSLGNVVDHVHWHFFPRYAHDPDFKNPPWLQMDRFEGAKLSPDQRDKVLKELKQGFKSFHSLSGLG
jgi:diadenosine tetraphosphate (Ap4A) HIT family hydrolase